MLHLYLHEAEFFGHFSSGSRLTLSPTSYSGRAVIHRKKDSILDTTREVATFFIMTTDGVVKAAGFRWMNEESRWDVENWNALRGLLWGCN